MPINYKFPLGRIVATPGALGLLEKLGQEATPFIARHANGDWGNVPPEDAQENELSVIKGFRILSSYPTTEGDLWIITEADRSATTLLLPDEY